MPQQPVVLFAYEFGSGLGHLNRLIAVARSLAGAVRSVFAVPDLKLAAPLITRALSDVALVKQGYVWEAPTGAEARQAPTHTLADVLALFSFAEPERLSEKVGQWHSLVEEIRPDLIVADFAPTLRLSTQGRVPMVVVGNGYTVPPDAQKLPPLRPWQDEVPASSRRAEQRILENLGRLTHPVGRFQPESLAGLFNGDRSFVCTITEFDPYAGYREKPVIWPFNVPAIQPGSAEAERSGPDIFVYMAASHPTFEPLLAALNRIGRPTHLFVADQEPAASAMSASSPNLPILRTSFPGAD